MNRARKLLGAGLLAALLPLAGCDGLLDVDSPGKIADEDLNQRPLVEPLVVGMSADLQQAYDGMYEFSTAAGELWHGGSYDFADLPRGIILDEDVNGEWGSMHQARWVAENGIERIRGILGEEAFNRSRLVARAHLLAGLANRFLGEHVCATTIDGGPEQPNTVHFERAIDWFDKAIQIGGARGATDIIQAAYGGRASAKAWTGDWAGAVQDAQQVPIDHVTYVHFAGEDVNELFDETHNRFELTVWNTEFEDLDTDGDGVSDDPRVPWRIMYNNDGSVANGANGADPHYQQRKYTTDGADIPAVKGTEMLILRAEAALRSNDIGQAYSLMNQARAYYKMAPLAPAATMAAAWQTLHAERGATLWLEHRRLWDLRRWQAESGPAHHPFLDNRPEGRCMPISDEEKRSNPNLAG